MREKMRWDGTQKGCFATDQEISDGKTFKYLPIFRKYK